MNDLFVDNVAAVRRTTKYNKETGAAYRDTETGEAKRCSVEDHVRALDAMVQTVGKTLFVGGIENPAQLTDAGNWDVEVIDAFYQLVMLGKVVYG